MILLPPIYLNIPYLPLSNPYLTPTYNPTTLDQFFVKANFSFSPYKDNLIPCQDAGLEFKTGDILHILNKSDNNWWQVNVV